MNHGGRPPSLHRPPLRGPLASWCRCARSSGRTNQKFVVGKSGAQSVGFKALFNALLNVVCKNQIRTRARDLTNERNFVREVLRIIGSNKITDLLSR